MVRGRGPLSGQSGYFYFCTLLGGGAFLFTPHTPFEDLKGVCLQDFVGNKHDARRMKDFTISLSLLRGLRGRLCSNGLRVRCQEKQVF